jgi:hypothetical protein
VDGPHNMECKMLPRTIWVKSPTSFISHKDNEVFLDATMSYECGEMNVTTCFIQLLFAGSIGLLANQVQNNIINNKIREVLEKQDLIH